MSLLSTPSQLLIFCLHDCHPFTAILITCVAMQEGCVAALNVKGNFMFESATHRWGRLSHTQFLHLLMHHATPDRSTASLYIHTCSPSLLMTTS